MKLEIRGRWAVRVSVRLFGRLFVLGSWSGRIEESLELPRTGRALRRWETGPLVWTVSADGDALEATVSTQGGAPLWTHRWDAGEALAGSVWPLRASGRGLSLDAELRLTDS